MDYIQLLQRRLERLSESKISNYVFDEFFRLEPKILDLQRNQIENHQGFDDKRLFSWSHMSGRYSPTTQTFASLASPSPLTSKPAGEKYNFVWSGDFMSGFDMRKAKDGLEIFSTGTGSGGKQSFFESYANMFGLNSENTETIESEVLYYVLEKTFREVYL